MPEVQARHVSKKTEVLRAGEGGLGVGWDTGVGSRVWTLKPEAKVHNKKPTT